MFRSIGIKINGKHVAKAFLREDVAPLTSDAIWQALPIQGSLMHCTCSGECVFFWIDAPLNIDTHKEAKASNTFNKSSGVVHGAPLVIPENLTCYVSRGDIVLTPDKNCIMVYGRRCVIRAYVGEFPSNAFAFIKDDSDLDYFEQHAKSTLQEGAKTIVFYRLEEN